MTDPTPHDAIDLARFAEITAHLRQFPEASGDEVLARLGVAKPAWQAASARWRAARDAELEQGATSITRAFGAAFARARKRLEAQRPSLASLGSLADRPVPAAEPAPPSRVEPPVPTAPAVMMREPPEPPAYAPRPPSVAPPAFVAPPALVPAAKRFAGTVVASGDLPVARLPFAPPGSPDQAFAAAVAHAQAAQGPASAARGAARYGETLAVSSAVAAPHGAALPFGAGATPASNRPPAPSYEATVALSEGADAAPPVPAGVPDLTLPQYASLRADVHRSPDQADAILARYGVPRGGRPALDAHWRARFEADPLLRMMFAKAYATYVAWLREQPGG